MVSACDLFPKKEEKKGGGGDSSDQPSQPSQPSGPTIDANAGTITVSIDRDDRISLKYTADSTAVAGLGAALTSANLATYVKAFILGSNVTTWTEVVAAAATGTNNKLVIGATAGNNAVLATRTDGVASDTAQAVPMESAARALENGIATVAVLACQEAVRASGGNYTLDGASLVNNDPANCRLAFQQITASNQSDVNAGTIEAVMTVNDEISLKYTADSTAVAGLGASLTSANLATYVKAFILGSNVTTWTEVVAAAATGTNNKLVIGATAGNNAVLATRTDGVASDTAQAVPMESAARALGNGIATVAVLACQEAVGASGGNYTLDGASLVNNDKTNCRLAFERIAVSGQ